MDEDLKKYLDKKFEDIDLTLLGMFIVLFILQILIYLLTDHDILHH